MVKITEFYSMLPHWAVAVIVVLSGWLMASVLRFIVTKTFTLFSLSRLFNRTGVSEFLRKGEVNLTPAQLAGRILYWLVMMVAFLKAAQVLDITTVTQFRRNIEAHLPSLISGGFVLAVGLILVNFLAGFVRTLARNEGSPYANLWSRITRWIGTVLVVAVALEQADVRGSILAVILQVVIAALAFGTALAFGLGCKDIARNAMEKFIAYLKERHTDISKSDLEG